MPDETPAVAEEETPPKPKTTKAEKSSDEKGVSYEEWLSMSRPAFKVSRAMVAGALRKAGPRKKTYTKSEVKEALKAFGAEVK